MKVLIVDQCSGSKDYPDPSPVFDSEALDSTTRSEAVSQDGVAAKKARNLYSGRQQALIDEATNLLRQEGVKVDRYFISAGFGLIEESTLLPPYEVTFGSMSDDQIRHRSKKLSIQSDLLDLLAGCEYDIVFLPLAKDYYKALDLPELFEQASKDTNIVLFNRPGKLEENHNNVLVLRAKTDEAREFGVIVVALKGKLVKNFAEQIVEGKSIDGLGSIRELCMYNPQGSLGNY